MTKGARGVLRGEGEEEEEGSLSARKLSPSTQSYTEDRLVLTESLLESHKH